MEVWAIHFRQGRVKMYLTVMGARNLVRNKFIDWYDPDRQREGYQRKPMEDHVNKIAKYLKKGAPLLPVAGLINILKEDAHRIEFRPFRGIGNTGTLVLPNDLQLRIVDMQHRILGFQQAFDNGGRHLEDYPLPVCVLVGLTREQEAEQFYIINTKAKKLKADLARRLLIRSKRLQQIDDVQPWIPRAILITMMLNEKISNPWKGKMRRPNEDKGPNHVTSEEGFVTPLKYILLDKRIRTRSDKTLARYISDYWTALSKIFPTAFSEHKKHLIQRSIAQYAFHMLAPAVFKDLQKNKKRITATNIEARLSGLRRLGDDFWKRRNKRGARRFGGAISGYMNLRNYLADKAGIRV